MLCPLTSVAASLRLACLPPAGPPTVRPALGLLSTRLAVATGSGEPRHHGLFVAPAEALERQLHDRGCSELIFVCQLHKSGKVTI